MYLSLACCKVQLVAQSIPPCSRCCWTIIRGFNDRRWDGACCPDHWPLWTGDVDLASHGWLRPAKRRHYVAGFIVTSFSWWTFIYWKNNNTCLMGDAILRIPRDARVRAYRTRDTYDGVVPVTSKRQPYCLSIYIELSGRDASGRRFPNPSASRARRFCSSWNRLQCSMLVMFLRARCWLVGAFSVHIQPQNELRESQTGADVTLSDIRRCRANETRSKWTRSIFSVPMRRVPIGRVPMRRVANRRVYYIDRYTHAVT